MFDVLNDYRSFLFRPGIKIERDNANPRFFDNFTEKTVQLC